MSKGWTEERRRKQAETIRKNKPWLKSTGPKTKEGKIKSSCNALKHGAYSEKIKDIDEALAHQRAFLKAIQSFMDDPHYFAQIDVLRNKLKDET